ncbi:type VII secretion integral membrane protein EccD [Mycobacterium sp. 1423905.2]|nr:type VII secretion integral membrane protein EccD [Mycobacterium sp. 1423905.2]
MVSPAPEQIRVSVYGGRTQLDIALPLDVPISGFVSDLARLVRSRDTGADDDPATKDERRSFWVLSRFDTGAVLRPDRTLREAGVASGELLRLSAERALSPPTLYDDVVDAVGRLNKAAYAAWGAVSARWMAFVAIHLAAIGIVYCLVGRVDAVNHWAIVGLSGVVALTLVGGAAMAHRSYRLDDVAAGLGWAAIPITAGIAWTVLARYGEYGLAAACGAVVVLCVVYDRVIGTGHWAYLAGALLFGVVGVALLCRALHLRADVVFVSLALCGTLLCLLVPRLTARLGRFKTPTVEAEPKREAWDFENPFEPTAASRQRDDDSGVALPTAEAVWAKAESAAITRAAVLFGLAAAVAVSLTLLLSDGAGVRWPTFALALGCAAVLGLRSRIFDTWFERAAVAAPALAIVAGACVLAQRGVQPMPVVAVAVLLAIAVSAALAGLSRPVDRESGRLSTLAAYCEYVAVGSLLPLGLWVVGVYQRLGLR